MSKVLPNILAKCFGLYGKIFVMFEKIEILIIIFGILFLFYVVISLGAGKKRKFSESPEIARYLFGVRILIIIIAIVALILWSFL